MSIYAVQVNARYKCYSCATQFHWNLYLCRSGFTLSNLHESCDKAELLDHYMLSCRWFILKRTTLQIPLTPLRLSIAVPVFPPFSVNIRRPALKKVCKDLHVIHHCNWENVLLTEIFFLRSCHYFLLLYHRTVQSVSVLLQTFPASYAIYPVIIPLYRTRILHLTWLSTKPWSITCCGYVPFPRKPKTITSMLVRYRNVSTHNND